MDYRSATRAAYRQLRKDGHRANDALRQAKFQARYDPNSRYGNKHQLLPSKFSAYDGAETTTLHNGWKLKVEFQHDSDSGPPWLECDGMGVIKEYRRYGLPGEYDDWRLSDWQYYDWKETLPEVIRDGWNAPPYHFANKREQAMNAMRSTYENLREWCNDKWWYVGLIVTLLDENDNELGEESCWGYESESMDYITSEVRSWAAHLIRTARRERREAAHQLKINNRFAEAMECGV